MNKKLNDEAKLRKSQKLAYLIGDLEPLSENKFSLSTNKNNESVPSIPKERNRVDLERFKVNFKKYR